MERSNDCKAKAYFCVPKGSVQHVCMSALGIRSRATVLQNRKIGGINRDTYKKRQVAKIAILSNFQEPIVQVITAKCHWLAK